jgi:NTP pyrophosphatase (non-canonical NTP hydrolase)
MTQPSIERCIAYLDDYIELMSGIVPPDNNAMVFNKAIRAALTEKVLPEHHFHALREANIARNKEWNPNNSITLTYRATEFAGEAGEACNEIKKLERERLGIAGSRTTLAKLAEELADVIICADLIAMHEGIDLDAAVRAKFNATSEKVGLNTRMAAKDGA